MPAREDRFPDADLYVSIVTVTTNVHLVISNKAIRLYLQLYGSLRVKPKQIG